MLIVDSTSNYDESYSIFNFVWEIICYMWEQTLETNSVKLGNGVIIGPLWVKYGGKIACQPPSAQNPGHAPGVTSYMHYLMYFRHKVTST